MDGCTFPKLSHKKKLRSNAKQYMSLGLYIDGIPNHIKGFSMTTSARIKGAIDNVEPHSATRCHTPAPSPSRPFQWLPGHCTTCTFRGRVE